MAEEQQQEQEQSGELQEQAQPEEQKQEQAPPEKTEAEEQSDKEAKVLEQLADGSALRHSLDPAVSDFSADLNAEEVYLALSKFHAQGLVESTVPNPDVAEDGVIYRWQLNFAGRQYLTLRGKEHMTPEEVKADADKEEAERIKAVKQENPDAQLQRPAEPQ